MQPEIEISFRLRRKEVKEAIFAISEAVSAGYDVKDTLQAALPQFSPRRIALAIDALITANLAEVKLGVLKVHSEDMDVLFELLKKKFVLPLCLEDAKDPRMRREFIRKLGCRNPAGVEMLVIMKTKEA